MDTLITICARGGSKGIPKKNIKQLNGTPLIAYTIKIAQEFQKLHNCTIALSTDNEDIRVCAEEYGLLTKYIRPAYLSTDSAGKIEVIRHILEFTEKETNKSFDYIMDLDITSPLRTLQDLNESFEKIKNVPDALNIFSVSPASRNPYFNMVQESEDGFYKVVVDSKGFKSRQTAPKVYDMNASFYIYKKKFFLQGCESSTTNKSLAFIMDHVCFDIDNPHDFQIMEILLREKLLDFTI